MDSYLFPFEKLETWQDARRLVKGIYELTRRFPVEGRYGLTSQINRAAVSVASNLAEGSSRTSLKDQGHFSQQAFSSLMELACQINLASDIGFSTEECASKLRKDIDKLAYRINALRKPQIARAKT